MARQPLLSTVRRAALLAALVFVFAAAGGCNDPIKTLMVYAPNRAKTIDAAGDPGPCMLRLLGIDRQHRIAVGPPEASLLVSVIDPRGEGGDRATDRAAIEPKGTILLLHGYRLRGGWFRGTAKQMAEAGYRVVLVDLRGHGRSSGQWISFGAVEARDTVQVIDALERLGEVRGPIGMWGISMGAVTSIRAAAADGRIGAVVAVAPYTRLRDVAPNLVRHLLPLPGLLYSEGDWDEMVAAAAAEAGFDPDEAESIHAITRRDFPVLIMHGGWDLVASPRDARRLADAAASTRPADRAKFILFPCATHITAGFDVFGDLTTEAIHWFDGHLGGASISEF